MTQLTLPWPSKDLSPNARIHWARKARAAKVARRDAAALARAAGWTLAPAGRIHLRIEFYPPTKLLPDDDNMLSRFKPWRDGIADALGIDDRRFVSHPQVMSTPRKGGAVVVTVMEAAP